MNLTGEGIASESRSGTAIEPPAKGHPANDSFDHADAPSPVLTPDGCQSGRMDLPAKRVNAEQRSEGSNPSPSVSNPFWTGGKPDGDE